MNEKHLINQLELAYAPLTAYEYANLKNDKDISIAMDEASLYIIAQRPVITFENVTMSDKDFSMEFEIHQKENPQILFCKLPLDQENFFLKNEQQIELAFNFLDGNYEVKQTPLNNVCGFTILKINNDEREFVIWFSPEKLIQNVLIKAVECQINGDISSFLKYKVHYVGKATKQNILDRLNGHSTFQEILSLEQPVTSKELPANEIVILAFEFYDNLQIRTFGWGDNLDDAVDEIMGKTYPNKEKVFLDAEKALINALKPNYNKEMFKNYPKSRDGLYKDNYNSVSYSFMDPITLEYTEGEIKGGLHFLGGDSISVTDNTTFKLNKYEEKNGS